MGKLIERLWNALRLLTISANLSGASDEWMKTVCQLLVKLKKAPVIYRFPPATWKQFRFSGKVIAKEPMERKSGRGRGRPTSMLSP
jgi:hypothetical protein